jgi:hypothetical protein
VEKVRPGLLYLSPDLAMQVALAGTGCAAIHSPS